MSMTFKFWSAADSDGVAYIDMPAAGTIVEIDFAMTLLAGAGGPGRAVAELSRSPTNQTNVNNAKGVIAYAAVGSPAASQGAAANSTRVGLSEKVKAGERLYLNCAGTGVNANVTAFYALCTIVVA